MVLMLVVAGATLAVFAAMERGTRDNQRYNDSQLQVRVATDTLAKRLRNLASPATRLGLSRRAADRARERAGLRLPRGELGWRGHGRQPPEPAALPLLPRNDDKRLYVQRQTWTGATPAVPADDRLPGQRLDRDARRRRERGQRHPRRCSTTSSARPPAPTPSRPPSRRRTTRSRSPSARRCGSTRIRRASRPRRRCPRACSCATRTARRSRARRAALGNKVTLNASASDDPEGNSLLYEFFDNGSPLLDGDRRDDHAEHQRALHLQARRRHPLLHGARHRRRQAPHDLDPASSCPARLSCNTTDRH